MNTKMKVLALALLGLAGYAGSAVAGCPASPVPPWTSVAQLGSGTVAISAGGLDGSACKMDAALGASLASVATVLDDTPNSEARYRFQFLFNADGTGNFGATDGAVVFSANAAAAANGRTPIVQIGLTPGTGGAKRLTFVASCASGANFRCVGQTTDLPAGMNRIEVDLNIGADGVGYLKYWLNAAAGTTEPAETGSIAINGGNADWTGVDKGVMGLGSATPSYIGASGHAGQIVSFDTFDSRRQTYIGW